jgi:hypothetical protein
MCLRLLNYNLDRYTCYDFLELFLKNGIVFEGEISMKKLEKLYSYNLKIINNFIIDQRYFDFNSLQIACAIVRLSREAYKIEGWPRLYEKIYKIRSEDFMNCYFVIKTIYNNKSSNSRMKSLKLGTGNFMENKNNKNIKTFESPFDSDSGISSVKNGLEDIYACLHAQTNTHIPIKSRKSEVNMYIPRSEIPCNNHPSVSSVSCVPTYTPNYFNMNSSQLTNNNRNNDYNVNSNHISRYNNLCPKQNKIKEKSSYEKNQNSSDNNDLNSTVDEIVENNNKSTLPNRSARLKSGNNFENYEFDEIHNISPFNIDYYPSYNSNNYLNYPGNSAHVYSNPFSRQNFAVKSNTSFINSTCINDNFFINRFYLDYDGHLQQSNNVHWFN